MYYKKLCMALMLYAAPVYTHIKTIPSLEQAYPDLETLDHNALVVFDVDETLIIPVDKIRRKHPEAIMDAFHKIHFNEKIVGTTQWHQLDSIIWKHVGQELIEPESTALIKKLQATNIRVIALTHMHAGGYYAIESLQDWRYKQLCELGIDLAIHNNQDIIFTELPKGRVSHPVLYKGVFATSRSCTKGQALAALIQRMEKKPSHVIFFDDLINHVTTVDQEMNRLGIACTAFHYTATEYIPISVDQAVATFQYQYLIKHGQWLSDLQAAVLMHQQTL